MILHHLEAWQENAVTREIQQLYETAFPEDERRDFGELIKLLETEHCCFKMLVAHDDDGLFAGFFNYWEWDDFVYGEHFAVVESMRGRKCGEAILQHFLASTTKPVVIEVEPPVAGDITERRVRFYERNGGVLHDSFHYIQPPYSPTKNPIELKLMTFGNFPVAMLRSAVAKIASEVYGVK